MSKSENSFLIQDGQTVVFIGDSITDCGRRDAAFPFGTSYVKMVIDLITAKYPERAIKFFNQGISGDVAPGLQERWADDVLVHNPNWVSVMVGINDLHRRFNPDPKLHIPVEKYREAYAQFLTRTKENTDAQIILVDPFYISKETNPNSQRKTVLDVIPEYIAVVDEMAQKFEALHIPMHEIFQKQLQYHHADTFCPEPIHPNLAGHTVMANAWLEAVGWHG
ncbi:MAG: SGNH/GDSL hydrolase family protein [Phycisphaerae bacterium]|nr:SGNH/GDSL hydrolase family protein [Phycisphaerae bacterium]